MSFLAKFCIAAAIQAPALAFPALLENAGSSQSISYVIVAFYALIGIGLVSFLIADTWENAAPSIPRLAPPEDVL